MIREESTNRRVMIIRLEMTTKMTGILENNQVEEITIITTEITKQIHVADQSNTEIKVNKGSS